MFQGFCRLANASDLPAVAELRFRARFGGGPVAQSELALFVDDFVRIASARPRGEALHWVLQAGGQIVATRSAVIVRELPEPDALFGRSAFVSRCYQRPKTGGAAAARLLSAIEDWALSEGVELIVRSESWTGRTREERAAPLHEAPPLQV